MVDVTTGIDIDRPPAEAFAFAADPANATSWYANIASSELLSAGPLAVGSQIAFKAKFLGRELAYTYEVTELVPGERLVMQTADGPFPMRTTYEARPGKSGAGTHFTLRNDGEPTGFSRFAAPMMEAAMRRANNKDLRKLKELLET